MHILMQNERTAYGTIRCSGKHILKNLPPDKEMKRGGISYFILESTSLVKRMDNRGVYLASSFISTLFILTQQE